MKREQQQQQKQQQQQQQQQQLISFICASPCRDNPAEGLRETEISLLHLKARSSQEK